MDNLDLDELRRWLERPAPDWGSWMNYEITVCMNEPGRHGTNARIARWHRAAAAGDVFAWELLTRLLVEYAAARVVPPVPLVEFARASQRFEIVPPRRGRGAPPKALRDLKYATAVQELRDSGFSEDCALAWVSDVVGIPTDTVRSAVLSHEKRVQPSG